MLQSPWKSSRAAATTKLEDLPCEGQCSAVSTFATWTRLLTLLLTQSSLETLSGGDIFEPGEYALQWAERYWLQPVPPMVID